MPSSRCSATPTSGRGFQEREWWAVCPPSPWSLPSRPRVGSSRRGGGHSAPGVMECAAAASRRWRRRDFPSCCARHPGGRRLRKQRGRRMGRRARPACRRRSGLGHRTGEATGAGLSRSAQSAREAGVREVSPDGPWPNAGLVLDAVLGTGARGAPRGLVTPLLARLAELSIPLIAIDGPSGLDLADGVQHGPLRAALTVTFGGYRRGHLLARDESR